MKIRNLPMFRTLHRAKLQARRAAQSARIADDPADLLARLNLRRSIMNLSPLSPKPTSRYTATNLPIIRARTHNFLGEPQR